MTRVLLAVLLLLPFAALSRAPSSVVDDARTTIGATVAPAIASVRGSVQSVVPQNASATPVQVSPATVAHIVRWEVTSPRDYARRWQWPIWPGGASGITWGIGYDGGHQSAPTIARDWSQHPHAARLATTAGITGAEARGALPRYRDILVPFDLAERVFVGVSLPVYDRAALRAYGEGYRDLPADARGALLGNTYNRGASMVGDRNREKRVIRDTCIPARDFACIAAQLRSQCRLWRGTALAAGLCGRRESEARLVEMAR
jgi:hypothetical protein